MSSFAVMPQEAQHDVSSTSNTSLIIIRCFDTTLKMIAFYRRRYFLRSLEVECKGKSLASAENDEKSEIQSKPRAEAYSITV
eukprot:scaffold3042_cov127-Skeletonema_dohrnii-CCMP3373.AAC.5